MVRKSAFTLLEILIVVIIIGILAVALIPRLTGAQAKARDASRIIALSQISAGLVTYNASFGEYPTVSVDRTLKQILVPQYMSSLPTDPQPQRAVKLMSDGVVCITNSPGEFAYSTLGRNGNSQGAFVLGASMETEGTNANFVIDSTSSNPLVGNVQGCISPTMDASVIERFLCKSVSVGSVDNLSQCTVSANKTNLRYLLIQ